jgi:hypothetical protein
MRRVLVRYRVKPERVEENEQLVRAVYDELRRTGPAGLRYAAFKADDGVSFVHLAIHESGNALEKVATFQEYLKGLGDRTEEAPVVTELDEVGSYRLVGDSSQD